MGGAARTAEEHRYEYCGDQHCPRWPCRVYQEGVDEGRRRGYDEGHAAGYDEGFQAGIAACPGPHGKG